MRTTFQRDDGANAVEFALVLPILLMLIFGAITAGLTLNARQQLDHATREGARYAATLEYGANACDPGGSPLAWDACVRDRVVATAVGALNLTDGGICVSFIDEDGNVTSSYFGNAVNDAGTTAPGTACIEEDPVLTGARVHVRANTPGRVDAVLVRTGLFDLESRSISRYEEE